MPQHGASQKAITWASRAAVIKTCPIVPVLPILCRTNFPFLAHSTYSSFQNNDDGGGGASGDDDDDVVVVIVMVEVAVACLFHIKQQFVFA